MFPFTRKKVGSGNLLSNPGFEIAGAGEADVFASWNEAATNGAIDDETSDIHSGGHAAKITRTTGSTTVTQAFGVKGGATYNVTFWNHGDGTYSGRYLVRDATNSADIIPIKSIGVTGTSYTFISFTFTAPPSCTSARLDLYSPVSNDGISYFDDVSVVMLF